MSQQRCADCGTTSSGRAYLSTDFGVTVCGECFMAGSYS